MKQAILITAYHNLDHLHEQIQFFDDPDFEIYIHFDQKNYLSKSEKNALKKYYQVKLISTKFKVNWGGFNHLLSILLIMREAYKNPKINYFHLISGQDYPLKRIEEFKSFFESSPESGYLETFRFPHTGWGGGHGMDRVLYYNFYDIFDAKSEKGNLILNKLILLQKRLNLRRKFSAENDELFGGSTWWSLSRECVRYVLDYTDNKPLLLTRLKHTFCSEELYIPTVLMNSPFSKNIRNNNLRYIDWTYRNGNNPAILDETDFNRIFHSENFFARKFVFPKSQLLLDRIKGELDV